MELLLIDGDMDNSWTTVWFDSNNKEMTPAVNPVDINLGDFNYAA